MPVCAIGWRVLLSVRHSCRLVYHLKSEKFTLP